MEPQNYLTTKNNQQKFSNNNNLVQYMQEYIKDNKKNSQNNQYEIHLDTNQKPEYKNLIDIDENRFGYSKSNPGKTANIIRNKQCVIINQKKYKTLNSKIEPKIRNRRYQKLKRLHKQGFFQQEQIMLKYPLLYHEYVGKYKKSPSPSPNQSRFNSMSEFLQAQVVSTEYRRLVDEVHSKQNNLMDIDGHKKLKFQVNQIDAQQQQEAELEMASQEMADRGMVAGMHGQISEDQTQQMEEQHQMGLQEQDEKSPYQQKLEQIRQQDLQLQEQALIDYLQQQFMEGQLQGINYHQIDNDDELDNYQIQNVDRQQKYFQSDVEIIDDPENNTGIQDF